MKILWQDSISFDAGGRWNSVVVVIILFTIKEEPPCTFYSLLFFILTTVFYVHSTGYSNSCIHHPS